MHGPYTAEQAALMILGAIPPKTGYICPECQEYVREQAQRLAARIDSDLAALMMRMIASQPNSDVG